MFDVADVDGASLDDVDNVFVESLLDDGGCNGAFDDAWSDVGRGFDEAMSDDARSS